MSNAKTSLANVIYTNVKVTARIPVISIGWLESARKHALSVQDYVITLDLVEDVLVIVILVTGEQEDG